MPGLETSDEGHIEPVNHCRRSTDACAPSDHESSDIDAVGRHIEPAAIADPRDDVLLELLGGHEDGVGLLEQETLDALSRLPEP